MTTPSTPAEALAAALPNAVNFRVPLALTVGSPSWDRIAADLLANLTDAGWALIPVEELRDARETIGFLRSVIRSGETLDTYDDGRIDATLFALARSSKP